MLTLLDGEGALLEVVLPSCIPESAASVTQVCDRDGDVAVLGAVLALADGKGALLEVLLSSRVSQSAVSVT
jgi:hypothetical protein